MTSVILLVLIAVLWIWPVILASSVTSRTRGSATPGLMLGLFLGWIGVVIAYCLAPTVPQAGSGMRPCPYCAEPIQPAAKVCRFCGRDVPQVAATEGPTLFGRPITGTVCEAGHVGPFNARRCATCRSVKVRYTFADEPAAS